MTLNWNYKLKEIGLRRCISVSFGQMLEDIKKRRQKGHETEAEICKKRVGIGDISYIEAYCMEVTVKEEEEVSVTSATVRPLLHRN